MRDLCPNLPAHQHRNAHSLLLVLRPSLLSMPLPSLQRFPQGSYLNPRRRNPKSLELQRHLQRRLLVVRHRRLRPVQLVALLRLHLRARVHPCALF